MTNATDLLTPIFPNVLVRGISGRMQARSSRCAGCLIQSSQKLASCNKNTTVYTVQQKNKQI